MRVAALDLGSNTSLVLIAEIEGGKLHRVLHDETTITRMGQGVHAERKFHPEALARVEACLKAYSPKINAFDCSRVFAVATSAARDVSNGEDLIRLGQKYRIPIHIISGEHEARLTFRGALCDRSNTEGLAVIDVGGGSTEIITQRAGQIRGTSVDVGSVRLTELFVKSDPLRLEEQNEIREYAHAAFAQAPLPQGSFREVVAVAGTPTTLAGLDQKAEFSEERVHGFKLSLTRIEDWAQRLAALPLAERAALPGMQPKRADVLVAGTEILAAAIRALGKSEVTVSTRGVRFGAALAYEEFT